LEKGFSLKRAVSLLQAPSAAATNPTARTREAAVDRRNSIFERMTCTN
jgi:hypothetical protein